MALIDTVLPRETVFGLSVDRTGPIRSDDFETWSQEPENPLELIEGWVLPMSPGSLRAGQGLVDLVMVLGPLVRGRGWSLVADARHRLPDPAETVLFPDLALHRCAVIPTVPATDTAARVPDLVIEILGDETAERDRGPLGAKFLAYQMSGVSEYYHTWPDGRDAAGYRLVSGVYVALEPDADGFFPSPLLEAKLRLVPAALG